MSPMALQLQGLMFPIQILRAKVRWSCRSAQTMLTYYTPLLSKKGSQNGREAGEAGR